MESNKKFTIYIMVGCSGSGKTWRGKQKVEEIRETGRKCIFISKDEIREYIAEKTGIPLNKFVEDPYLRRLSNRLYAMQVYLASKSGNDLVLEVLKIEINLILLLW